MDQLLKDFVADRFDRVHSATPCLDYPAWIQIRDQSRRPSATLGLRDASKGPLFLEAYLDQPIEVLVAAALDMDIDRTEIVEIGCLAATPSRSLIELWCETAETLRETHRVAVATLTRPLRSMFARVGIPLVELHVADPGRLANADSWGRYYQLDPVICCGEIAQGAALLERFTARSRAQ
ncbi:thermostable hemolysin [Rhizorhabdus sp. FW153]|uniref:thermostable hemolysin n=1 Tax=Rhizorhabdus sp. FW153 TaxID=3400216 RepID=UPI003CF1BED8